MTTPQKYIVGGYDGNDLERIVAKLLEDCPELAEYGLERWPKRAPSTKAWSVGDPVWPPAEDCRRPGPGPTEKP